MGRQSEGDERPTFLTFARIRNAHCELAQRRHGLTNHLQLQRILGVDLEHDSRVAARVNREEILRHPKDQRWPVPRPREKVKPYIFSNRHGLLPLQRIQHHGPHARRAGIETLQPVAARGRHARRIHEHAVAAHLNGDDAAPRRVDAEEVDGLLPVALTVAVPWVVRRAVGRAMRRTPGLGRAVDEVCIDGRGQGGGREERREEGGGEHRDGASLQGLGTGEGAGSIDHASSSRPYIPHPRHPRPDVSQLSRSLRQRSSKRHAIAWCKLVLHSR